MQPYDAAFYAEGRETALRSARRMVPALLRLVPARSVVDVGCGVGSWLSVFAGHGVDDVLGIDGSHVDRGALDIPVDRFRALDLAQPFELERPFDLALSLEIAEHLPATAADGFVASLCRSAPVVMFSAAVPAQGGVQHVNEQWPEYWARRFLAHGHLCADVLRSEFWDDPEVSWWYAQNACLYVAREALAVYPALAAAAKETPPRSLAHPRLVERNQHRLRLADTLLELFEHAPAGARVLVADGAQLLAKGRQSSPFVWVPFLERHGEYWGAPVDSAQAIAELERLRSAGARALAIVWPCLWWLDTYGGLTAHLEQRYRCTHVSANVALWDLGSGPS